MGIGFSLILAAAGAVLIWAVNTTSSGFNYQAAGVVLLVVGIIGFCISVVFWSSWGGFSRTRVVDEQPRNTTTVIDR